MVTQYTCIQEDTDLTNHPYQTGHMSTLKVIGAGLHRTGTVSLKAALAELGFGPTYHSLLTFPPDCRNSTVGRNQVIEEEDLLQRNVLWRELAEERDVSGNLEKIFNGFLVSLDAPAAFYYQELLELSPDAKVVLTIRDDPEVWVKSVRNALYPAKNSSPGEIFRERWVAGAERRLVWPTEKSLEGLSALLCNIFKNLGFNPYLADDAVLAQFYMEWTEKVARTVPEGNLLVFNVKQGWEPLCRFLEVPVPHSTFPRINSQVELLQCIATHEERYRLPTIRKFLLKASALTSVAIAAAAYLIFA